MRLLNNSSDFLIRCTEHFPQPPIYSHFVINDLRHAVCTTLIKISKYPESKSKWTSNIARRLHNTSFIHKTVRTLHHPESTTFQMNGVCIPIIHIYPRIYIFTVSNNGERKKNYIYWLEIISLIKYSNICWLAKTEESQILYEMNTHSTLAHKTRQTTKYDSEYKNCVGENMVHVVVGVGSEYGYSLLWQNMDFISVRNAANDKRQQLKYQISS